LHDGRASTVDEAIRHDGEAARVRDRYAPLKSAQQQLLDFLKSI
jgi:CxxC motif-containing protein (DUF1111 family)